MPSISVNYDLCGLMSVWSWGRAPEEESEDGEGADVDAAAGDGREDAADEAGHEEHEGLPDAEVGNGVEGLAFVLPESFCNDL